MQRLQFALFQMVEAKRYLISGPLPALRLALILLDNTAEILLDRWIEETLESEGMFERIQRRAREVGVPETHPQFIDLFQQRFLTAKDKRKVSRVFDEKIRYVADVKQALSLQTGLVLSHLHRYRNEAYHTARVRTETVRTFGMISIELCCQLLETFRHVSAGYSSSEDFSWLSSTFGLNPQDLWHDDAVAGLLARFREGLPIGDAGLRETLATNLESRMADLDDGIHFISAETRIATDRAGVLAMSQRFTLEEIKRSPPYRTIPSRINKPVTAEQLDAMYIAPDLIRQSSDSLAGFRIYADTDAELERIEFMVAGLVGAIEQAIQFEIDRARGK